MANPEVEGAESMTQFESDQQVALALQHAEVCVLCVVDFIISSRIITSSVNIYCLGASLGAKTM